MARSWYYFLFLLWLMYLFVCGILLFTKGFLLSRRTLPHKSSCTDNEDCAVYQKHAEENPSVLNKQSYLDCLDKDQLKLTKSSNTPTCIVSGRRVILIVVDALKYDFAYFNSSLKSDDQQPFQNRIPIFNELLTTLPNNSRLFKFIANPPTTTMQRLKGLTTGSLPTFIDAGSNFATPEIDEDNILDQLISQNKSIVFMGDDTWLGLYPKRFLRQHAYPSFNVWDLDTVDNGILNHLKPEIYRKDWNLLIAHFLGVDHCGHRYGPYHAEMTRKLNQMNDVIRDVVDTIDDDTMLFVIGDHGMTSSGDHGGESEDEVTSAMFVYSPVALLSNDLVLSSDTVNQVDLVPTLASVLGFAIPFSNLGKVILYALPESTALYEVQPNSWDYPLDTLLTNIEQIMLYVNTYSRYTNVFSKDKISAILERFYNLKKNLENVKDLKSFKSFQNNAIEFLNFVRILCEEVWVQFDSFSMSRGLVLTFLLLTFSFFIIEGIPSNQFIAILEGGFLYFAYGIVFLSGAISFILEEYDIIDETELLTYVLTLTVSIFTMAVLVVQNWHGMTTVWYNTKRLREWTDIISRIIHLCCIFAVFSNSFVVEEGTVLSYLLITLIWQIASSVRPNKVEFKTKGNDRTTWISKLVHQPKFRSIALAFILTILLRVSHHFWRCREEQKWCVVTAGASSKTSKGNIDYVLTLCVIALFVSVCRMWLRSCGNLVGFSPSVTLARYAPSVIVVCTGGFWVLQSLPNETRSKLIIPWQLQILPWIVFGLIVLDFFFVILRPLCVYTLEKKTDLLSVYGQENIIPQLFHQVKQVMKKSDSDNGPSVKNNPVVYGLATCFSSVYLVLTQFLCLLVILLLGDLLASSVVLMFVVMFLLLTLFSLSRLESTLVTGQLFSVPWPFVLCWGLLSSYFFYGTGHQPTFPGIHWYSAFVGTGGEFGNYIIPAILVGINTFCSQIITGLALPMLLIAPFTMYIMLPKWLQLSNRDDLLLKEGGRDALKQGELCLYEKEGLTQYAVFKLTSKYIFFHGTRIFACMLAAAIHCRHLMVWMIFAPRFMFEGIGFFVTLGTVLVSYFIMNRISSQIDYLMDSLLKKYR